MLPIHPGRILKRELAARGLSANRFAIGLRVPSGRITDIMNGKRGITPETALRLAPALGTRAGFLVKPSQSRKQIYETKVFHFIVKLPCTAFLLE